LASDFEFKLDNFMAKIACEIKLDWRGEKRRKLSTDEGARAKPAPLHLSCESISI